mmetsp:Transcript_31810/g.66392  ORF Transcript_31810/g.66392 Transcript_31810/m.66392 type:complete len:216 (+) Transcript_31810:377-1024(+)
MSGIALKRLLAHCDSDHQKIIYSHNSFLFITKSTRRCCLMMRIMNGVARELVQQPQMNDCNAPNLLVARTLHRVYSYKNALKCLFWLSWIAAKGRSSFVGDRVAESVSFGKKGPWASNVPRRSVFMVIFKVQCNLHAKTLRFSSFQTNPLKKFVTASGDNCLDNTVASKLSAKATDPKSSTKILAMSRIIMQRLLLGEVAYQEPYMSNSEFSSCR